MDDSYLATNTNDQVNHDSFFPHENNLALEVDEVFLKDVLDGLKQTQKTLPCKYFYDETGSQLFEEICQLDEYYITRTELLQIGRAHV